MKKLFSLLLVSLALWSVSNAQVSVQEPEFADQVMMLKSDSEGVLLSRENASVQKKTGAGIYMVGIGKVKTNLSVAGNTSTSKLKGGATTRLIVKAKDNGTDPSSFVNIFKFEQKKKERIYQIGEIGTFTRGEVNGFSTVEYNAKKYGESSYYIVISDLTPGEYGIILGDPNTTNEKNSFKVTTFTVE